MEYIIEDELVKSLPKLNLLAFKLTKDKDKANDLVNETCLKVLEKKDKFKENINISGWFSVILKNIFINQYRREIKNPVNNIDFDPYQLPTIFTSEESDSNINYEDIDKLIDKNCMGYKCFIAHLNGYNFKQIADIFEINAITARTNVFNFKYKMQYLITGKPNKYYPIRKKKKKL